MPRSSESSKGWQQKLLLTSYTLLCYPAISKALIHLVVVLILSTYVFIFPLDHNVYWTKKSNVFNQYGTKIGWFWTLVTVGPFIWSTTLAKTKSIVKAFIGLLRLAVATVVWYFVLSVLIRIEHNTGECISESRFKEIPPDLPRKACTVVGGKWSPGIDISGHCFLLVFNILVMTEEAMSFQHCPSIDASDEGDNDNPAKVPQAVKFLFVVLAVFHVFWDVQLVTTCLYFHLLSEKILGTLVGIAAWALLYRNVFQTYTVPGMPVVWYKKIKKAD